jgi:hypothetical protein
MKSTSSIDAVIAVYQRDIDRSLLRENLKLTPGQRLEKLVRFAKFAGQMRGAGAKARGKSQP